MPNIKIIMTSWFP